MSFNLKEDREAYGRMRQVAVLTMQQRSATESAVRPSIPDWAVGPSMTRLPAPASSTPSGKPLSLRDTATARRVSPEIATSTEACTPNENQYNSHEISYLQGMNRRIERVTAEAEAFSPNSRDNTVLVSMIDEYERNRRWMMVVACDPTGDIFDRVYDEHHITIAECINAIQQAMSVLFSNAAAARAALNARANDVLSQRHAFETQSDGAGGLAVLRQKHNDFLAQLRECSSFKLISIVVGGQTFDAEAHYKEVADLVSQEAGDAAEDELDLLRDEYVKKTIPVPPPSEFSQSKRSRRFSFTELNVTNDYSWAVLTDILLANLDTIGDDMQRKGMTIQLNSAYRNPLRSEGKSRHQYGRACDLQVFDFDKSGGAITLADWTILHDLVKVYHPDYIEPVKKSGVGHVHCDWQS